MGESGCVLFLFFTRMDLNQKPIEVVEPNIEEEREPKTLRGFGFEYRTKVEARETLVRKFGESRYEMILKNEKPFVMLGHIGETIVIFIFY